MYACQPSNQPFYSTPTTSTSSQLADHLCFTSLFSQPAFSNNPSATASTNPFPSHLPTAHFRSTPHSPDSSLRGESCGDFKLIYLRSNTRVPLKVKCQVLGTSHFFVAASRVAASCCFINASRVINFQLLKPVSTPMHARTAAGQTLPSPPSGHPPPLLAANLTPPHPAVILHPRCQPISSLSTQRSSSTPAGGQSHSSLPSSHLPPILLAVKLSPPQHRSWRSNSPFSAQRSWRSTSPLSD